MKYVLFFFLIGICNIACNQQAVKDVSSISKDEKNIVIYSPDSVDNKDTSNDEHSENISKQINPKSIINNDGESPLEMFTLLSASSRSWISGVYGGGSGTEYVVKITILTSKQLDFDSLWLNNSLLKLFVAQGSSVSNMQINIKKGDEVTLRATDIHDKNAMSNIRPPFNFIGEALLYYRVNEERKYYIVSEIQKQATIYHK